MGAQCSFLALKSPSGLLFLCEQRKNSPRPEDVGFHPVNLLSELGVELLLLGKTSHGGAAGFCSPGSLCEKQALGREGLI